MKRKWTDALFFLMGSLLYAVSVNVFTAPNHIAPGGVTGLATLLHELVHLPIGLLILLLNIPLLIWAGVEVDWHFLLRTAGTLLLTSITIDLTVPWLPVYQGDKLLAALFGGVLSGAGVSCFYLRGVTTGGTDLAANLLNRLIPHLSLGKMILLLDFLVVILSAFVYGSLESPLYAAVTVFVSSRTIDTVLYGMDGGNGRMLFVISEKYDAIASAILSQQKRGVTALSSVGYYTGKTGKVLLCAAWKAESVRLRQLILQIDPDAFIIIGEAVEIKGAGFPSLQIGARKKEQKKS